MEPWITPFKISTPMPHVEQVETALHQHHLPVEFVTTPYTYPWVNTGQHRVLVDNGAGDLGPKTGNLVHSMQSAGISPSDIDVVIRSATLTRIIEEVPWMSGGDQSIRTPIIISGKRSGIFGFRRQLQRRRMNILLRLPVKICNGSRVDSYSSIENLKFYRA